MSSPTSPISPSHKRRSMRLSSFNVSENASPSPYTSGTTNGTTFSRRSSRTSQTSFPESPHTPRLLSMRSSRPSSSYHRRKSSSRLSIGSNISIGADNGLGNLADELEDALDDEYEMNGGGYFDVVREGSAEPAELTTRSPLSRVATDENKQILISGSPSFTHQPSRPFPQSPSKSRSERRKTKHHRTESRHDGSDCGPESDQEEDGFTPALAKRMREIESLARMSVNTEDMLSEEGGVIRRTTKALEELGPQTGLESNLSRIIAAYTSMATHRTHKTRDLFSQAHSLIYGNMFGLSEDMVDALLPELEDLLSLIAVPQQQNPLLSLQVIASQTLDLAHGLRSLIDTLQESKIQANTANRKLKSVKEMVEDMCLEHDLIETSMMLIQVGDWDRRCRERQAAARCREIITGFGDKWGLEPGDRPWLRDHDSTVS